MAEPGWLPCWDRATAASTISTEAVSPSRAVFLATHAPLRIHHTIVDGTEITPRGTRVDEAAVLDEFRTDTSATGTFLAAIVGESGSGKSHLVRWVHEQLLVHPDDNEKVIYLPKLKTSLRAVVEILLEGLEGEQFDLLRTDVRRLGASMDQEALARSLVSHLADSLIGTERSAVKGLARDLVGPRGLAVLLKDPHVGEFMLRPGKFIPMLASQLLQDRCEGDPVRPPTFTSSDLPLEGVTDVGQAAVVTQQLLGMLADPPLQAAAVALLNDHLEAAVDSATSLGPGRMHQALLDVRREYASRKKEIVLLIEDFALFQGVQRDLLEAILEVGVRDGRTEYAPMRTLMAVTTGYFEKLPETALTRIKATGGVYLLNDQFGHDEDAPAQIASFIGKYLNAARIGQKELDFADASDLSKVPNHCSECPVKVPCHEGFGVSREGYGLYPFNQSALLRAVHSTAPKREPRAFVPRTVLKDVVRYVLVEHAESVERGTFPDERFRAQFPTAALDAQLSVAVRRIIEANDTTEPERRMTLLEFWGDAPNNADALPSAVFAAFALDPLAVENAGDVPPAEDERPDFTDDRRMDKGTGVPPTALRRAIEGIENWAARDAVMPKDVAADLRNIVAEAVVNRAQWNAPLMPPPGMEALRKAWLKLNKAAIVSIEDSGEVVSGAVRAPIRFDRTAGNAAFFQGILQAKAGNLPPHAEHVRRLYAIGDQHVGDLVNALQAAVGTTDELLVLAMRTSLIGAALAGHAWPGMDKTALLSAVLDDGKTWRRSDEAIRVPAWMTAWERHRAIRPELVDGIKQGFGIAQGTSGAVRMIDVVRALPLLRAAVGSWEWQTPSVELPDWLKRAVGGMAGWMACVETQHVDLGERLETIRRFLPKGTVGIHTVSAVRTALRDSIAVGLAPGSLEAKTIDELVNRAETADWQVVDQLERDLARAAESARSTAEQAALRIATAARDRGDSLEVILQFLRVSDEWLSAQLPRAEARTNTAGDAAARAVSEVLEEWVALTTEESA